MDRNTHLTNGGCLVTADGRNLPLRGATLTADAKAGIARVTLEQRFFNPFAEPLQVTYQMPLPADAAVSGFSFRIGDKRVFGEVDTKQQARARFEEAVLEGRTAALVDQERSSLFTQTVGNIPPQTEVVSELVLDQKLAFLSDGYWEWRFPTVVAPRYLGTSGRVADSAKVTVDVAAAALPVRLSLGLSIRDALAEGARPESPSHALHTEKGVQRFDVALATGSGASLDRDVVVRWKAGAPVPGVELDVGRPRDGAAAESAYALVTLVPPAASARMPSVARDLILLLDTSGSMNGAPIAQAQRVAAALVDSLGDDDFLEMISFSTSAQRWRWRPQKATASNRKDAQAWLAKLQAGGGTEMREGILESLSPLRKDAQRQVVLMTDGLIGFESEIVQAICERLPQGSRVHTVGIGSGVNRSLTSPAARAGRGVEIIIGLDEDPERGAQRIVARTCAPLVTRVELFGSAVDGVAPVRPCDLYAGAPALASLKLKPHGGEIIVRGETADGPYERRLNVQPIERGEGSGALAKLYAREQVEDLEVELAAGLRQQQEIDRRITALGLDFQISTRLTSWVAVSPEETVDPRAPKRAANVPQELPYGMSAEGLGLRAAPMPAAAPMTVMTPRGQAFGLSGAPAAPPAAPASPGWTTYFQNALSKGAAKKEARGGGAPRRLGASVEQNEGAADKSRRAREEPEELSASLEQQEDAGEAAPLEEAKVSAAVKAPAPRDRADAPAPPPAPPPQAPARIAAIERQKHRGPRRIKARLTRSKGRLVVQLTVEGDPLFWAPSNALIDTKAGPPAPAPIDSRLTTAEGTYGVGVLITLVLEVASLEGEPNGIFVTSGGESLFLDLTP